MVEVVGGGSHSAAGPGQHVKVPPTGLTHRHSCTHVPSAQVSWLHGLPSSQSASLVHVDRDAKVVEVVGGGPHSAAGPGQQVKVPPTGLTHRH